MDDHLGYDKIEGNFMYRPVLSVLPSLCKTYVTNEQKPFHYCENLATLRKLHKKSKKLIISQVALCTGRLIY